MIFQVFERLEVRDRTGDPVVITGRRQRTLLVALLLRANLWTSSQWLITALWGQDPPRSASANLKTFVWTLRQRLPAPATGERIETRRGEYRLVADQAELDLLVIRQRTEAGRRCAAEGEPARAEGLLREAAELWRGDLPEDLVDAPPLVAERIRLIEERWRLLEDWFELRLRCGDHADLVRDAQKTLADHPLRERLWGHLMLALYRSGRRAEALTSYQDIYALLTRELGITPGPELQRLHRRVLRDDPTPGPGPVPAPLPADLTSFTGRDRELRELLSAVPGGPTTNRARATVVTIDGMAGIGKTSFAVHAAHRVAHRFPDGRLFLDLHGFTQGAEPMPAGDALDRLLRALGVPADTIPRSMEDRSALFRARLTERRVLIVLDNVADEAQVLPLVPAAPHCLIIVTGRRRLTGIDDARSLSLDVLSLPETVSLFSQIVGRRRTRWEPDLAAELMELCGRLPLAIRIAGARFNARPTWTVSHLTDRLRDQQHRLTELEAGRRSVIAVLDVSYQHLTGELQRAFRLLGLHPGTDIGTDAAAALLDLPARHAERTLEALVDVHLLSTAGDRRYRFHDLVRQHAVSTAEAREPLDSRHNAIRRLLSHWVQTLTAAACATSSSTRIRIEPSITLAADEPVTFSTATSAVDWFLAERRNLLTGIAYSAAHGLHEYTWHLTHPLRTLFYSCGYVNDWLETAETMLAAARKLGDARRLAEALRSAGSANMTIGRNTLALSQLEEALELLTATGHREDAALCSMSLGYLAFRMGRCAQFLNRQQAAMRLIQELGDEGLLAACHGLVGLYLWRLGQYREALTEHRTALTIALNADRMTEAADSLSFTALVHLRLDDGQALTVARDALARYETLHDKRGQTYALNVMGHALLHQGDPAPAIHHLSRALALIRSAGERRTESNTLQLLGIAHRMLGEHGEARCFQEQALRSAREAGDPALEAEVLHEMGINLGIAGDRPLALDLHRQSLALAQAVSDPYVQALAHREIAACLESLGESRSAAHHRHQAAAGLQALGLHVGRSRTPRPGDD